MIILMFTDNADWTAVITSGELARSRGQCATFLLGSADDLLISVDVVFVFDEVSL